MNGAERDDPILDHPGDSDRGNNPSELPDPAEVAEGIGEPVHLTESFPSAGEPQVDPSRDEAGGSPAVGSEAGGSTGRGAQDEGKTDAEGVDGGGMAGSAGG